MFRIDVRPPGGLMYHEAENLKNSVLNADWIDYHGIGLEGDYDINRNTCTYQSLQTL